MAIVKYNNYMPGFSVSNLQGNHDYDRLGIDQSDITVDYTVSPAEVTVHDGSVIEANGDTYLINGDEVFTMANAAHDYITFNGTAFSSAATVGTFDQVKNGYYNGLVKTPIEIKKITREKLIKSCKEEGCLGVPILVDFQVQNFCGKRCDKCYLIASYERNGAGNNNRT